MEKKYVFLAHDLGGVGGAQRYVSSKASELQAEGWQVYCVTYSGSASVIDFSGVTHNVDIRLRMNPQVSGKRIRSSFVSDIRKILELTESTPGTQIIVESFSLFLALWGELLSADIGARHIVYLLEEKHRRLTQSELRYMHFKSERLELASIRSETGEQLSRNRNLSIHTKRLTAIQRSPVANVPFGEDLRVPGHINVVCVSRLEKPFVADMIQRLGVLTEVLNSPINLCIVGDGTVASARERAFHRSEKFPLLLLNILGFFSPIPRDLITQFDLGIGKAGGARLLATEGIPTIAYYLEEDTPAGLLGIDIAESPSYANNQPDVDFTVLFRRAVQLGGRPQASMPVKWPDDTLDDHIAFIQAAAATPQYYDASKIRPTMRRLLLTHWIRLWHLTATPRLFSGVSGTRRALGGYID